EEQPQSPQPQPPQPPGQPPGQPPTQPPGQPPTQPGGQPPAQPGQQPTSAETGSDEVPAGAPGGTAAEGAVNEQGIPAACQRFEAVDHTYGIRDDTFWALEIGPDGTMYVGTLEGRSYISHDGAATWNESWVVPEVKEVFGFAGQTMLLGSIR